MTHSDLGNTTNIGREENEPRGDGPEVSFIMPCYNEEAVVGQTVRRFVAAFDRAGHRLELVAVDNGSRDRTGEILRSLANELRGVRPVRVEVNTGYGNGILTGIPHTQAPWVGIVPADGQVDAEDAVRLYEDAVACGQPVLAKARRRFRMDGLTRKLVSIAYNAFFRLLFPGVASLDINGLPKLLPRDVLLRMDLRSRQWLLDPEMMIKAHYMGVRVLEYNVFARARGNGLSHVRASTCWEFFRKLLKFRFSGELRDWRRASRRAASDVGSAVGAA
ncbi:MAG TPA: glycosyltransferase family 2 protein [Gemmatimonadaceae bacterium]|nr:glycosyltransferase family 2 protein [Gemmatimonadaceae bacterium]